MRKNEDKAKAHSRWRSRAGSDWEVLNILPDEYVLVGPVDPKTGEVDRVRTKTLKIASLALTYEPVDNSPTRVEFVHKKSDAYEALATKLYTAAVGTDFTPVVTILWTVTPELAADLLSNAPTQRATSPTRVERLSRDITGGNWKISHQGFALGPQFELGDGQHRCLAILRSGKPIETQITWYSEEASYAAARVTWDTAWTRTAGSTLELVGEVGRGEGKLIVALLRAITHVDASFPRAPTNEDLRAMHEGLKPHIRFGLDLPKELNAPVRAAFVIAHRNPVARASVEQLAKLVTEKVGYEAGTAAHSLVLKLPSLQKKNQGKERPGVTKDVLSLIYKHFKGQPGVGVVRENTTALTFFLGDDLRESSSGR